MSKESERLLREIINGRMDTINPTTRSILLGVPAETVSKTYNLLLELGLTHEKIVSQAQLLSMNPETIQRNNESLKALGLTQKMIATQAALLGRGPKTLQRNYEFLRRFFSKKAILKQPQLLGISHETIEGSVHFLQGLGVDREKYPYVYTIPQCKRKKVTVILKERFGYSSELSPQEKKELIEKARTFVRSYPNILIMSEKTIKKRFSKVA